MGYNYAATQETETIAKLKLEAAIYNYGQEAEIFTYLANVAPEYKGQFNRRFETFLNKKLAEKFGTWRFESEHKDTNPDRDVNNVAISMTKDSYFNKYDFIVVYRGKQYRHKTYDLAEGESAHRLETQTESDRIHMVVGCDEFIERADKIANSRTESIPQFYALLEQLPQIIRSYNTLIKAVEAHNDGVLWPIANELRIK